MVDYTKLKEIGIWLDESLSKVDEQYISELKSLNINCVAIMVNRSNTTSNDMPWVLRAKKEEFERIGKLLNDNEIEVALTCWPQPNKSQMDKLFEDMDYLIGETKARYFEVDTESNWHNKFLGKEFKSIKEASEYLVSGMKKIANKYQIKTELTTFPYHQENSANALVAPYMDSLFPQAYSVANRDNGQIAWDDSFGPGKMQELSLKRTKLIKNFKGEYCMGLAAYDQKWPNHSEQEAMEKAITKAIELGITKVRFWSAKWVMRNKDSWPLK